VTEVDRSVAAAVAAAEERMRAEFELKLKRVKKAAKKKLKNTEEYRSFEEKQELRGKNQDEESGSGSSGEWQGEVGSRGFDLDVQRSDFESRDGENTEEYPRVGGHDVGANTNIGGENTEEYPRVAGQEQGKPVRKYPLYGVIYE
jgi:hypothetical protein